ncbi:MAG: zinc ribbon domain-containing protein [Myxococcales bacterium]|nr:zinc ribbon domain-containing protein [Myxococcales bacterium]
MSLDLPARCPHCGVEHPPSSGRFCDSCGRSVVQYVKRAASDDEGAANKVQVDEMGRVVCPSCGTPSKPPICLACFTRLPSVDDE